MLFLRFLLHTDPYGSLTDPYGSIRIHTDPYGSIQIPTDPLRIHTDPYGSIRIPYGSIRVRPGRNFKKGSTKTEFEKKQTTSTPTKPPRNEISKEAFVLRKTFDLFSNSSEIKCNVHLWLLTQPQRISLRPRCYLAEADLLLSSW